MEFDLIKKYEIELSDPAVRKNSERVSDLLAEDFQEIGSSGRIFSKSQILRELAEEIELEFKVQDFTFFRISENCILVKYKSILQNEQAHRSSVWVKRENNWLMLHHQGTLIKHGS